MSSIRKLVAMLGVLLASSSVLVGCSDDDPTTMGAVPVNSVQVTGTSANVVWSIVPNDKCGGYEVSILQGSREGSVLESKKFDNRTCKATFSGLTPNTEYVIKTQAIPGAGFSDAEVYYREFTTAPNVDVTAKAFNFYIVDGYDKEGNPTKTPYYSVDLEWPSIAESNCGGYTVAVYECAKADYKAGLSAVGAVTISKDIDTGVIANHANLKGLRPETVYTVASYARPNSMCDYAQGDVCLIEFTTPAAK